MSRTKENLVTEEFKTIELTDNPRFRNFDWGKAKSFYYVAKCGSFVSAGRFLNISQSALSRQIILLEGHLGCPLFSRHSGGVKLTRKGEELFSIVETTFVSLKGFTRNAHVTIDNGKRRKIRIATTHALASYILSDLILDYNKNHPEFTFELIGNDHLLDIVLNDVDITIHPLDLKAKRTEKQTSDVRYDLLFSVEKKLYASVEYIEKYGEPKTIEDLKDHHIVAFSHSEEYPYGDVNWILSLGMPEGKLHEPIYTSNSVESLIDAAKKGIGIVGSYEEFSILRNAHLKNILPHIKDQPLKEYFIYPKYLEKDLVIQDIKKYLHERLSAYQKRN